MTITRVQKQALLSLGAVAALLVAYFVYLQASFRLVKIEPAKEGSTVSEVVFTFNKDLANPQEVKFTINPEVPGKVSINGKKVTFTPDESYELNKTYGVGLQSVTSKSGDKITDIKSTFTTKYVEEKKLSQAERERAILMTDRLERENSILAKLPYSTNEFKVDYEVVQNAKNEDTLVLRVTLFPIINRPDQYNEYLAQLSAYKGQSLAWIEQNSGGKVYNVTFNPDVPEADGPQQHTDDYTGDGVPPEQQP